MWGRSIKKESGTQPASSAVPMTLGLSAMKMPFSGSSLLRSCASVKRVYTASSGIFRSVTSMILGMVNSCFYGGFVPSLKRMNF